MACPSTWEGTTHDGSEFYARYRHGRLQVELNGVGVFTRNIGDGLDGYISYDELKRYIRHLAVLPDSDADLEAEVDELVFA
jgi:hypothetical protein